MLMDCICIKAVLLISLMKKEQLFEQSILMEVGGTHYHVFFCTYTLLCLSSVDPDFR